MRLAAAFWRAEDRIRPHPLLQPITAVHAPPVSGLACLTCRCRAGIFRVVLAVARAVNRQTTDGWTVQSSARYAYARVVIHVMFGRVPVAMPLPVTLFAPLTRFRPGGRMPLGLGLVEAATIA